MIFYWDMNSYDFLFGYQDNKFLQELRATTEPRREKTNVLVSDLVQHKPGCIATEDG